MREHFKISRASEYFEPSELSKRTGRSRENWIYALLKELMDNALDITDSVENPEIEISVSDNMFSVWDNGAGMSSDLIKTILDFDSRVSDKFAYQSPTRGAQGNAFKTFLGLAYNLGGYVQVESQDLRHTIYCEANAAGKVDVDHQLDAFSCTGTKIIIHSADQLKTNIYSPVFNFHLCNPFVQISYLSTFDQDELPCSMENPEPTVFYKSGNLKKIKPTDATSIHWYDLEKFKALAYLQADKENIPLGQFVGSFHGLKASKKRKAITAGFPDLLTIAKDDQLCADLLHRMKGEASEIKPTALGLVGKDTLEDILQPRRSWYKKTCGVHDGKPWAFEIMVAECHLKGLCSAVNHSVTFEQFLQGWLVDDWLDADGLSGAVWQAGAKDALVFVHFIGISPAFVSLGKDRINFPYGIKEAMAKQIRIALTTLHKESKKADREEAKADREWRKQQQEENRSEKHITLKEAVRQALPAAVLKATDNETIPANKRGLYYATREMVQTLTGAELKYDYFGGILTGYWHEIGGRHPLIYYDPRGILYEPHSSREVPLGTKDVLDYYIPAYQYNKILYVEKKGIWPAIESAKIAQKYDMAVIAAEGFATEAARALMQKANDQDYTIFVFHDADPAGYEIARTISEATKTMPNNNISIVDLGLDIKTCVDMDLPAETFTRKKALPSGQDFTELELEYFFGTPTSGDKCWTGCKRIEINAMGSRDMVNYLDRKIGEYLAGDNKVIPPEKVQQEEAEEVFQEELDRRVDAHFKEMIDKTKAQLRQEFKSLKDHKLNTEEYLKRNIYDTWKDAIAANISDYVTGSDQKINEAIEKMVEG